jgi:hypothetical protein
MIEDDDLTTAFVILCLCFLLFIAGKIIFQGSWWIA